MSLATTGAGPSSKVWDPSKAPGLEFWWEGDLAAGYSDDDLVDSLVDQGPEGNDASPDGVGNRGTFKENILNSLPVLRCTLVGSTQYKIAKNLWSSLEGSIYAVVHTNFFAASNVVVSQGTGIADDFILLVGANNWGYTDPGGFVDGVPVGVQGGGQDYGAWVLAALHFGSNLAHIYRNGIAIATNVDISGCVCPTGDNKTRVGGFFNFAENNFIDGDLAGLACYTQNHHGGFDSLITAYFLTKYGL